MSDAHYLRAELDNAETSVDSMVLHAKGMLEEAEKLQSSLTTIGFQYSSSSEADQAWMMTEEISKTLGVVLNSLFTVRQAIWILRPKL